MSNTARVGLVGATGYTGVELLRLLVGHPHNEVVAVTSRGERGRAVADLFPSLRGHLTLDFCDPEDPLLTTCDIVFFATPNGVAMGSAAPLLDQGVRIVDLSADFRLQDAAEWAQWYGQPHTAGELLKDAVYGLPELHRTRIATARLVANPGCYPTAVQLGFAPLLEQGVVEASGLIADTKSGVSGAGRGASVTTLFGEAADSLKAYGVNGHRHHPEIVQGLQQLSSEPVRLTFVPHLTPMIRGIHATLYAKVKNAGIDLQALFEQRYAGEPFVDVMPSGSHPDTRSVRGANVCRVAVHRPQHGDTVVVLAVEDNLVKGAAGQAIQNMNIMLGLDETSGLTQPALMP